MKKWISVALVAFVGFSAHAAKTEDTVVATVGKKNITLGEFNKKYSEVKSQALNPPTKEQFLEDMVRYEVGLQEAEKKDLAKDPIVIDRVKQEMYKALLEKEIGQKVQKIQVSEKEMENWYKKNPEIRTSHILIELKPGATSEQVSEAESRAKKIYEDVKSSKRPFEELARLYSDDTLTKQAGGDVGWQSRVTLFPSYYDSALNMKVGEISSLVKTPFGFHIVKVTGRRSYDEANKMQVHAAVFDEKRREVFNQYFGALEKSYNVKTMPSEVK